jgi:2-polyprenyl-6-methoxyphenol hydroxylase-like FAD-dependent oxidoreductase
MSATLCSEPRSPSAPNTSSHVRRADIAIIGGGLAGAAAASVLGREGYRVILIDRHSVYPAEFRVEKLAGDQIALLRRLKLLDCVAAAGTRYDQVVNIRHGRVIDRTYGEQYGILYGDIVKAVRGTIPDAVERVVDRVTDIQTGSARPRVELASEGVVEARLVVLATGMADVLRQKLGIRRHVICEKHSISFGFSIAPPAGEKFGFPALTSYGEKLSDRIDYVNFFPIGDTMRANLFTYLDHRDVWARSLRQDPKQTLLGVMPGLAPFLGDFRVVEKVQNWIMDLYAIENYVQDGVVLIGDAFQTSCPAAGTGVSRLLTDVERLCAHAPRWLATPGMQSSKVAQFYDDPAKRRSDARAVNLAQYRRSLSIDESMRWTLHRQQAYLRRRLLSWVRQWKNAPRARPAPARAAG